MCYPVRPPPSSGSPVDLPWWAVFYAACRNRCAARPACWASANSHQFRSPCPPRTCPQDAPLPGPCFGTLLSLPRLHSCRVLGGGAALLGGGESAFSSFLWAFRR